MRPAVKRTLIFLLIIGVSILFGIVFDKICTRVERKTYPLTYSGQIDEYNESHNVPAHLLLALMREESGFASNKISNDGRIGLFQLSAERFDFIRDDLLHEGTLDSGMLYDPATNIRYGTAYLSWLIKRYGTWDTAIAAWRVGTAQVDEWLADESLVDQNGVLVRIPDKATRKFVEKINKTMSVYDRLYGTVQ